MISDLRFNRGFTLIELAITVGLGVILVAMAVPIYGNLQVSAQINEQSALITQTLRSAREQAVAGYNNSAHGVFFRIDPAGADSYILYQGSSYANRNIAYDQTKTMGSALSFQNSSFTLIGADVDVNYSKTLGMPNNIGTLLINHSASGQKSITVNSLGAVTEN